MQEGWFIVKPNFTQNSVKCEHFYHYHYKNSMKFEYFIINY